MSRPGRQGFAALYDEQVWHVYGFFGYRVGSREEAEDLTQLTFERALRGWHGFDERRASARTWLMAIARNLLVDHYRRQHGVRHEPLAEEQGVEGRLGHDPPDERGLGPSPELGAALGRLGERARELIALRFGGDLTGEEIAELTGLSLANVQQIHSRALRRLRTELEGSPEVGGARTGS